MTPSAQSCPICSAINCQPAPNGERSPGSADTDSSGDVGGSRDLVVVHRRTAVCPLSSCRRLADSNRRQPLNGQVARERDESGSARHRRPVAQRMPRRKPEAAVVANKYRNHVHPDVATLTRRGHRGRGADGSARVLVAFSVAAKSARCGHSYQNGSALKTGRMRAGRRLGAGDVQPSLSGDDVRRVAPCRAMNDSVAPKQARQAC